MVMFNFLAIFLVKKIVTNSQAIRNDLESRTMFLSGKTEVVYYGIDSSRFRPAVNGEANKLRNELSVERPAKLVGMIARYDVWKGHLTFLEAASIIRKSRSDVKFVIIGGLLNAEIITPLRQYYDSVQERRTSLGLDQDVIMISHRDDIPELLRGLDIFVCPSKREPIPLIVFEAMASGVPVVAADSGGIPEQISHEKDGFLFRTDDSASLSKAILTALDEKNGNRAMVQAARTKIEQQFSVGRFVKDMEKVYGNVMEMAA
jgi:glycosyltransferase involved in cell wall biosynthesis